MTEQYRSWIVRAVDGLDHLADAGVELVDDVAPFERRKLWLLNGPHSAVAYGGMLAGHATIARAVTDPLIARFARDIVEDTLEVAPFPLHCGRRRSPTTALRRFANPALGHTCAQVGTDGSAKLPQRLLPVVAARQAASLGTSGIRPRDRHLAGGCRRVSTSRVCASPPSRIRWRPSSGLPQSAPTACGN